MSIDPGLASRVLAGLNPIYRAALVLRHVDGLSVAAIADHLDRSVEATGAGPESGPSNVPRGIREHAMSDDLDLRVIDQRHEPDPEFRAALRRRVAGIVSGGQMPDSPTEPPELVTIEPSAQHTESRRRSRLAWVRITAAAAAAAVILALRCGDFPQRDDHAGPDPHQRRPSHV